MVLGAGFAGKLLVRQHRTKHQAPGTKHLMGDGAEVEYRQEHRKHDRAYDCAKKDHQERLH
jgi:hypothetical protein